jgi:hypothetical protein
MASCTGNGIYLQRSPPDRGPNLLLCARTYTIHISHISMISSSCLHWMARLVRRRSSPRRGLCVCVMHGSARTTYVSLYACVACGSASELSIYLVSPFSMHAHVRPHAEIGEPERQS